MAAAIRNNAEWMQHACDAMAVRLGEMYMNLAESWVQKGQQQQAMLCLERVVRTFPGTRQAEAAQFRLAQLKGLTKLRQLNLSRTAITDEGLAHLSGLARLSLLDLRGTRVTAAGVKTLSKTLPDVAVSR